MVINTHLKSILAVASFVAAIGFGIAGLIIPPPGQISGSVLLLISQFLVLSAGFIGMSLHVDLLAKKININDITDRLDNDEKDLIKIQKALERDDQIRQLKENKED